MGLDQNELAVHGGAKEVPSAIITMPTGSASSLCKSLWKQENSRLDWTVQWLRQEPGHVKDERKAKLVLELES